MYVHSEDPEGKRRMITENIDRELNRSRVRWFFRAMEVSDGSNDGATVICREREEESE